MCRGTLPLRDRRSVRGHRLRRGRHGVAAWRREGEVTFCPVAASLGSLEVNSASSSLHILKANFVLFAVFGRHLADIDVFRGSNFRDNPPLFQRILARQGITHLTAKGGSVLAKLYQDAALSVRSVAEMTYFDGQERFGNSMSLFRRHPGCTRRKRD